MDGDFQIWSYCETHKTMNTRNIYGLLVCWEK